MSQALDVIRTERTGVTGKIPDHKRALLYQGMQTGVVDVLYDIIEAECIKQETKLINLEPHQKEQILAEYRMSKAFWQIFVGLQKTVQHEVKEHLGQQDLAPALSEEQEEINETLDPTLISILSRKGAD